jgi:hypothetical protein
MLETLNDIPVINTDTGALDKIRYSVKSGFLYESIDFCDMNIFERIDMIREFGYVVPTRELLMPIISMNKKWLSIGAGRGYLEHILQLHGVDIIATDLINIECNPYFVGSGFECTYTDVMNMDAISAIDHFKIKNVFLSWPPDGSLWPKDVIENCEIICFIGESFGGRTGHDSFHELLSKMELMLKIKCVSFDGIDDYLWLYKHQI